MRIEYKKKIYHIHWPERFDKIILDVEKKYRPPGGYVNWKEAEADGMLKGLPASMTLRDFSQRASFLRNQKDPKKRKRKLQQNKAWLKRHPLPKGTPSTTIEKDKLFSEIVPEDIKKKHGWKPRGFWTEEQREILFALSEKYRKSKVTIDWKKLVKDKKVKKLPTQDSFKLCKYYNSLKRKKKGGKTYIKQRREEALRYKYENYNNYLENQENRRARLRNSVNDFLLSKIKLR